MDPISKCNPYIRIQEQHWNLDITDYRRWVGSHVVSGSSPQKMYPLSTFYTRLYMGRRYPILHCSRCVYTIQENGKVNFGYTKEMHNIFIRWQNNECLSSLESSHLSKRPKNKNNACYYAQLLLIVGEYRCTCISQRTLTISPSNNGYKNDGKFLVITC
jgi:hypothetical protein